MTAPKSGTDGQLTSQCRLLACAKASALSGFSYRVWAAAEAVKTSSVSRSRPKLLMSSGIPESHGRQSTRVSKLKIYQVA
ncbi:hypothetical protein Poly41_12810 [Novipirellula artificiosorum]|uniref:Uncharacterized protein n=1 Tax=Novipirellula artificiosorum TaxID=2528016 RepID=A0A5C6DUW2_9BACT|nr:hypothetical protein Poly41_12810 [Novipirellula artificiosorum]